MRSPTQAARKALRKFFFAIAGVIPLAAIVVIIALTSVVWGQAPTTQSPTGPQWQTDAGGQIAFEVASVKQNKRDYPFDKPMI